MDERYTNVGDLQAAKAPVQKVFQFSLFPCASLRLHFLDSLHHGLCTLRVLCFLIWDRSLIIPDLPLHQLGDPE